MIYHETEHGILYCGDCLDIMKTLQDNSVDAVVTDPPYGLSFMGKKWDYAVPSVEIWAECLRVLKPGGYLLSFAGTRTQHRIACGIEDAGFEIRDMIAWVYGSGFPKSLNVANDIARREGARREGARREGAGTQGNTFPLTRNYQEYNLTDRAKEWEGWGTALKPAHEPITVARKPISEPSIAANVLKWGTGAINIDGCRVKTNDIPNYGKGKKSNVGFKTSPQNNDRPVYDGLGRFPANLIHDGSDEVVEMFPESKSGSAARFFYCAKASKAERGENNIHPTVKPIALMEYLIKLVAREGYTVLDPFLGSGTTAIACVKQGRRYIGCEMDKDYCEIAVRRIESELDQTDIFREES